MIKVFTAQDGLNPGEFVALRFPCDANTYLLKNVGIDTLYMRSDKLDPLTEDSIGTGGSESFITAPPRPAPPLGQGVMRFAAGDTLYWVRCTGPLVLKLWW